MNATSSHNRDTSETDTSTAEKVEETASSNVKYSSFMLYNTNEIDRLFRDLTVVNAGMSAAQEPSIVIPLSDQPMKSLKVSAAMSCSSCRTTFSTQIEQREHFKSDWHRFNLKQKLKGDESLTQESYNNLHGLDLPSVESSPRQEELSRDRECLPQLGQGGGKSRRARPSGLPSHLLSARTSPISISSSSSSTDSDDEVSSDMEETVENRRNPKVFLRNGDGRIITLYRCVLHGKQDAPLHDGELIRSVCTLPEKLKWAIVMIGGGHFAGAIFNGMDIVVHKTFHRYTVRGKQGSSQSSRDNKQVGGGPHSGGANMRRYNEMTLVQEVQALLESWDEHLKRCHCIFYRAPGSNKAVLFGGKAPPFKRNSNRLRTIPFSTGRATFEEVRRIHQILCTVFVYDSESDAFLAASQLPPLLRRSASPVHGRSRRNRSQSHPNSNSPAPKGKKNGKENSNVNALTVLHKTITKQESPTDIPYFATGGESADDEDGPFDMISSEMVVETIRRLSPFGSDKPRQRPPRSKNSMKKDGKK